MTPWWSPLIWLCWAFAAIEAATLLALAACLSWEVVVHRRRRWQQQMTRDLFTIEALAAALDEPVPFELGGVVAVKSHGRLHDVLAERAADPASTVRVLR